MDIHQFVGHQSQDTVFEDANQIEINKNILKFGSSVYQFKNVTGFHVGEFDKEPFPRQLFILLLILGFATLVFIVGIIFLGLAAWIFYRHRKQESVYGLAIYLNSGKQRIFRSTDKDFLYRIVNAMYRLMSEDSAMNVLVDMSNRS
ncbi:MAG: DUF6232 family protein, partial [Amphritea sp.]|nr:DUF6232 family protein [Amphritea sp.]